MIVNIFLTITVSIITSGAVTVVIAYLLKRQDILWGLRREACEEALNVVEAVFSNYPWSGVESSGKSIRSGSIKKEKIETEKVRHCYNKLVTYCKNEDVPRLFKEILFPQNKISADIIVDFRNAIRRELGLKGDVDKNREQAFIGKIVGDDE